MSNIAELIEQLGLNKKLASEAYKGYKKLKEAEEGLKAELLMKMAESGAKSFKGDKYGASITHKADIEIIHEQSVIEWLQNTPNVEADAYIGLKRTEFKNLARDMLKNTGELAPGTETVYKDFVTIKEN